MSYSEQNKTQKVFTAVWELEAEVNNGGFEQYFFNTSGDGAQEVEQALRTIGAQRMADIVKQAVSLFPLGPPPVDLDERRGRLESVDAKVTEKWDTLDQAFFKYPDSLTDLLYGFVKEHPEEFGSVP
jgi:hypothetical protein